MPADDRFYRTVTLVETKFQTQYSPHKPDLHFLMRNDPYFYVGYAPKIESGASHNIKFQKTKFSQKITSKIFFKVIFLEIHSCIHVFWPNFWNKFLFFSKIWQIFLKISSLNRSFFWKIFCQIFEKNQKFISRVWPKNTCIQMDFQKFDQNFWKFPL